MTSSAHRFATILDGRTSPYDFYAEARAHAPIFWSEDTGGWVVSRRRDVLRVLQDEDAFGPLGYGAGSSAIHGRIILHMEGQEHRKKSALLGHRIRSPRIIDEIFRPLVADLCSEYLD